MGYRQSLFMILSGGFQVFFPASAHFHSHSSGISTPGSGWLGASSGHPIHLRVWAPQNLPHIALLQSPHLESKSQTQQLRRPPSEQPPISVQYCKLLA